MSTEFKYDDLLKVEDQNRVIRVKGFTKGLANIPDGFIICRSGEFINPKFCTRYNGAKSVLTPALTER